MRLGVTRDKEQLRDLIEHARTKGVEILPLPLTDLDYIPFEIPSDVSFSDPDWLVFTSTNGVRSFFEHLATLDIELSQETKLAVVGPKTARALTETTGLKPDLIPDDNYGELLYQQLVDSNDLRGKTVVYPKAEKVNYDPAATLAEAGATYIPVVCYRATSIELDPELPARLTEKDYCLFTAPSKVTAFHEQFGRPVCRPIAMGRSTAKTMNEVGWSGFATLKTKNINSVLEQI